MIIYNPHNEKIIKKRLEEAEALLGQIKSRYCFITGSFLFKQDYQDIDIFVISRSKKHFLTNNKKVKITVIDFNDLYSLFYHSIAKSCVAKGMLPVRPVKATMSDYWHIINEAVPTILNRKEKYHKDIRFLVLYTEYFTSGSILDTFQLDAIIKGFSDYKDILKYIKDNVPSAIKKNIGRSYLKRFFYTQAGYYRKSFEYSAQQFLYELTHMITRDG